MSVAIENIKVGDWVSVQTYCDGIQKGIVDDVDLEGKDGRPTIGFQDTPRGEGRWCYAHQILNHRKA